MKRIFIAMLVVALLATAAYAARKRDILTKDVSVHKFLAFGETAAGVIVPVQVDSDGKLQS